jgi:hypothetical protein
VTSPRLTFHFGLAIEPGVARSGPQTAVITSFGLASLSSAENVLDSISVQEASARVTDFLLRHWDRFWPEPITQIEFRAGDGAAVDIF